MQAQAGLDLARPVGLALGGGAARGWAHVGVARRLDPVQKGIRPHRARPGGSADGVSRTAETPSPLSCRHGGRTGKGVLGGSAAQNSIIRSTGASPVAAFELAESAKPFLDGIRLEELGVQIDSLAGFHQSKAAIAIGYRAACQPLPTPNCPAHHPVSHGDGSQ